MTGADFLQLDPAGVPPGGLASWLTGTLRDAVADGRLAVGARVPASRTLATQLGVSRGVVVEAYQRLTDEGLLSARSGGGTRVSAVPGAVRRLGAATRLPTPDLDLSPGVPDLSAFPRAAWAKASREVLAEVGSVDLGYGDPRGVPALREALAVWLGRTRGITVSPDEVLVVNGVAQGLVLLARWLVERGRTTIGFRGAGVLRRPGAPATMGPGHGAGAGGRWRSGRGGARRHRCGCRRGHSRASVPDRSGALPRSGDGSWSSGPGRRRNGW